MNPFSEQNIHCELDEEGNNKNNQPIITSFVSNPGATTVLC